MPSTKGKPIEINSLDESLLTVDNAGKVYKVEDKLYKVKKITSLKGLTIKFNEHIEPCPLINDDSEFECSGIAMGDDYSGIYYHRPSVSAIRKLSQEWIISFTLPYNENWGGNGDLMYSPLDGWFVHDGGGNIINTFAPGVIYNFDCPALNENPEFIEWVFANAKVYPNFESINDINSFKLVNFFYGDVTIGLSFQEAFRRFMWYANKSGIVFEFDIPGQYTASFLVNGEVVTKTFTNVNVDNPDISYGLPVFSNNTDELVFLFIIKTEDGMVDENGNLVPSPIKYNGNYWEGEIEFTKFDCGLDTKDKDILSCILSYTTVSGEYHNGLAFEEYVVSPKEYNGTMEVN